MAVAGEEILFRIAVDGAQAKRELGAISKSAETMGGSVGAVTKSVEALRQKQLELATALGQAGQAAQKDTVLTNALRKELEATTAQLNALGAAQARVSSASVIHHRDMSMLTDATGKAKIGFFDLTNAGKRMQQQMGPQAAAISSIANALGDTNSQTGKAIQMGGQLVAAWAAGGPLGVAVVGLSAGVIALTQHWEDLIAKQDEALAKQYAGTDKAIDATHALEARRNALRMSSGKSEDKLAAISKEMDEVEKKLQENRALRGMDRNQDWKQYQKQLDLLNEIYTLERKRAAEKKTESGPKGISKVPTKAELVGSGLMGESALKLSGLLGDAALAPYEDPSVIQAQAVADAKVEIEDRSIQERIAANKLYNETVDALGKQALAEAQAAASMGLGVFQGYLASKIAGEEHAEEKATAAFMQGIGNQLVGIGTRSLFEGGAKMFNPVTAPIGAAEMIFGGSAIAAGLGLGAAGAAIAHTAGGGTVGKPMPDSKASTDRGVGGSRGSSSSGGGGSITYSFNYGVAGPQPDETARTIARLTARATTRGFNTEAIMVTR